MNDQANMDSTAPDAQPAITDGTLLNAFLQNVPDIVFFKDRDCRFIAVSETKARRHHLAPAELVGASDEDFFSEQHAQRTRADENEIMATGTPQIARLERTHFIDGRAGWTEVTKLPLNDEDGRIIGTFGLSTDVTEAQQIKVELEQAKRNVIEASRSAGMAEVATGVLHNVGNVLTSLNVSANVIAVSLHRSKSTSLGKLSALLQEHAHDLGDFVTCDPKGRRVPDYIESLARHWGEERDRLTAEIASLQENIDHIKAIVMMQQACATRIGVVEPLDPATLMEDAVRLNSGALARRVVTCVRDFQPTPPILAEKAKVLQILVNLIRNAKHATDDGGANPKIITLRVACGAPGRVLLAVQDNGIGIPTQNLSRLFTHGFTTRTNGHGFGLHSSLTAAKEMNGSLTAQSAGIGHGATFTLDLPAS